MAGWRVARWGWGRPEAGVLWVVVCPAGLLEMEAEPPPQSESSMFPPLLQPAPQPFCSLEDGTRDVRVRVCVFQSASVCGIAGSTHSDIAWCVCLPACDTAGSTHLVRVCARVCVCVYL